jgi:tetratricopeptide (TPR) repeat protein
MKKFSYLIVIITFITNCILPTPLMAQTLSGAAPMPEPGAMAELSPSFIPAHLVGMTINVQDALKFDFIIHKGDMALTEDQKPEEYRQLAKYFLAALAIPDEDQWVNLSPYEGSHIIKDDFGKTEMGRDLLAQDYLLKQLTASLMHPDSNIGKRFWERIYQATWEKFGTTDIPVDTFNKIWITPDSALILEKDASALILKSRLKVLTERDYLSLDSNALLREEGPAPVITETTEISSAIVKEVIIPEIEREVNEGQNFANLRQIYSAMVLATWYKKALRESLLGKIYADKAKVAGVDQDPANNEVIYQQYIMAFKKGVFNFIKEDYDRYAEEMIPRKYFSGGWLSNSAAVKTIPIEQARPDQIQPRQKDAAKNALERVSIVNNPAGQTRPSLPQVRAYDIPTGSVEEMLGYINTRPMFDGPVDGPVDESLLKEFARMSLPSAIVGLGREARFSLTGQLVTLSYPRGVTVEEWARASQGLKKNSTSPFAKIDLRSEARVPLQKLVAMVRNLNSSRSLDELAKGLSTIGGLDQDASLPMELNETDREEVFSWLGLHRAEQRTQFEALLKDATDLRSDAIKTLIAKIAENERLATSIETEAAMFGEGWIQLQKKYSTGLQDIATTRKMAQDLKVKVVQKLRASSLGEAYSKEIAKYTASLAHNSIDPKDFNTLRTERLLLESGRRTPESVASEERAAIDKLRGSLSLLGGWQDEGSETHQLEGAPAIVQKTDRINCVGRTALVGSWLRQLGMKVWTAETLGHVFLLVRLADGKYEWVDPSTKGNWRKASDDIADNDITNNTFKRLGEKWKYQNITVGPFEKGVLSTFYRNSIVAYLESREYAKALKTADKYLAIRPRESDVHVLKAASLFNLGQKQMAEEALKDAVHFGSEANAYLLLSSLFAMAGQIETAKTWFKKVEPPSINADLLFSAMYDEIKSALKIDKAMLSPNKAMNSLKPEASQSVQTVVNGETGVQNQKDLVKGVVVSYDELDGLLAKAEPTDFNVSESYTNDVANGIQKLKDIIEQIRTENLKNIANIEKTKQAIRDMLDKAKTMKERFNNISPTARSEQMSSIRVQVDKVRADIKALAEKAKIDNAMVKPGGIDLNAAGLDMQIKRDGNGVPLPVSQQDLENIHIDGLVPQVISIQPVTSLPMLSEATIASDNSSV